MLSSSWERSKYVGLLGEHYYRKKLYLIVVFAEEKQPIIARNCMKLHEIAGNCKKLPKQEHFLCKRETMCGVPVTNTKFNCFSVVVFPLFISNIEYTCVFDVSELDRRPYFLHFWYCCALHIAYVVHLCEQFITRAI